MRRALFLGLMAAVVISAWVVPLAAKADCYPGGSATCVGGAVALEWRWSCQVGCEAHNLVISRSCSASGPWIFVWTSGQAYGKYTDPLDPKNPCLAGYYYKFTLSYTCGGIAGAYDEIVGPVVCN